MNIIIIKNVPAVLKFISFGMWWDTAVFANTWLFTTVHLRERSQRYAQPKYNNCLSYRRPYIVPSARVVTEVCAAEVYKLSEL